MQLATIGAQLTPVLVIAILVSAAKPFLEQRLPPGSPLHDAAIRLLALALGVAGMGLDYLARTTAPTGPGFEDALGAGLLAGVGAIATYHLIAGNLFDAGPRSS